MLLTPTSVRMNILGRDILFHNQKNKNWTHPYEYDGRGDLASSGCGIFSLCHAAEWLTGRDQDPNRWADFACTYGGRGDDGTDRPVLLHTLMTQNEAAGLGFRYEEDGLRNDDDTLYDFLLQERGVAFCNLRVGHIVTLVAARELNASRQVLAIDSVAESAAPKVNPHVHEVLPDTLISYTLRNDNGLLVGYGQSYAAFWVDADLPRDFNLLHRV